MTQFISISTNSVAGTDTVAEAIAAQLRIGDIVLLNGGLATGKTTFVKAAVRALGSSATVTSPTFTLAQFYDTPRGKVLHVDTYRLTSIHEFRDLGLEPDIEDSITFIEWGDKVAADFPDALSIEFTHDSIAPDLRVLTMTAESSRMTKLLDALAESPQQAQAQL